MCRPYGTRSPCDLPRTYVLGYLYTASSGLELRSLKANNTPQQYSATLTLRNLWTDGPIATLIPRGLRRFVLANNQRPTANDGLERLMLDFGCLGCGLDRRRFLARARSQNLFHADIFRRLALELGTLVAGVN